MRGGRSGSGGSERRLRKGTSYEGRSEGKRGIERRREQRSDGARERSKGGAQEEWI